MKIRGNKELTLKEAVRLSLLKWEYIAEHDECGDAYGAKYPELQPLQNSCGMCEKFLDLDKKTCNECPLVQVQNPNFEYQWCGCERKGHPYRKWRDTIAFDEESGVEYAKEIITILKEIKWD